MKSSLLIICAVLAFSYATVKAEARELTPACAAEKERLILRAKAVYQPLDTSLHDELMAEVRSIERFCTDEKLLDKINARYARQQKRVMNIQQNLAKAADEKKTQDWIDSQTSQLREAKEELRSLGEERNVLLRSMGQSVPVETGEVGEADKAGKGDGGLLEEPLVQDHPAYNQ